MSRDTPISHKQMEALGWERVDAKPWGKLSARWKHRDGWELRHCGHPTAVWPWELSDPKGRIHCVGRAMRGEEGRPTHGYAFATLRQAAEYVERDGPGAVAAMDREVLLRPEDVRWRAGMKPPEPRQLPLDFAAPAGVAP